MTPPANTAEWSVLAHPLFIDQLQQLVGKVEALRAKDPDAYKSKNATKRLKAILELMDEISRDPTREVYRQGDTLGDGYKHWFRAKFFQQYRLFFRFHGSAKVIVLAWVNDDSTLRAYDSRNDAYRVFARMLDHGNPPDDWDSLLLAARGASDRARDVLSSAEDAFVRPDA
jgi:toxin YhaV